MEQSQGINFKLGCYTHSSDFGFGGALGLPGVHWNKNYACYGYSAPRPNKGTKSFSVNCPKCNKKVVIKVHSVKSGRKLSILYGALTLLFLLGVILVFVFDLDPIFKVWPTIFGILFIFRFAVNTFVHWDGGLPKLRNPIRFINGGHKLFFK